MQSSSLTARRPAAADLALSPPTPHPTAEALHGAPMAVSALTGKSREVVLTPKGERYVAEHQLRAGTLPRLKIERAIDRHLALVEVLLALLDDADGDPDVEPSLAAPHDPGDDQRHWAGGNRDDLEWAADDQGEAVNEDGGDILDEPHDWMFSDDCEPDPGDSPFYPNGSHLFGGGSGI